MQHQNDFETVYFKGEMLQNEDLNAEIHSEGQSKCPIFSRCVSQNTCFKSLPKGQGLKAIQLPTYDKWP